MPSTDLKAKCVELMHVDRASNEGFLVRNGCVECYLIVGCYLTKK